MSKELKNWIAFLPSIVIFGLFNYRVQIGLWCSLLVTICFVINALIIYRNGFLKSLGLKIPKTDAVKSFLLFLILLPVSYMVILLIAESNHFQPDLDSLFEYRGWYVFTFFQTLNEEILLGFLFLRGLNLMYRNPRNQIRVSLLAALLFSALHFIFYKIVFHFIPDIKLGIFTLLSLFFAGMIRNNLILLKGHVGYSWALHLAWNCIFFHIVLTPDIFEGYMEIAKMNLIMGNKVLLGTLIIIAVITTFKLKRNKDSLPEFQNL
jgi:hypothetical protein